MSAMLIQTGADAAKLAREQYDPAFLRWVAKRTGAEWRVNPYNTAKVELVTREDVVLVQVMAWGELIGSGALEPLANAWAREFPYFAMTRRYKASGDCVKGRRRFRTDAELARFIRTTPLCVTFHN